MPLKLASKTGPRHHVVLACEDPAEFQTLWDEYIATYRPRGGAQSLCVEDMVAAEWRLRRTQRVQDTLLDLAKPGRMKPGYAPPEITRTLAALSKYRANMQSIWKSAHKTLLLMQKDRAADVKAQRLN